MNWSHLHRTRQGMTSTGFAMFSIWYLLLKIVKPISTINELFGLDLFLPAANFYFCPWFVIFSFLYFYTFLILPCRSQSERAGDYLAILPCTVPTRSQLGIIWPVGFTLSVIRQWSLSASAWRCYYSEEPAVFIPVTQGKFIYPAKTYTNLNPLKYSKKFWVCETSPAIIYSLLEWGVSCHTWQL